MPAPRRIPDDGSGKERIIASMRGWVADFVKAVANDDQEAVYLLLAKLRPAQRGPGIDATAALLLLADIAGHGDPGLVAEATGRSVTKHQRREEAA